MKKTMPTRMLHVSAYLLALSLVLLFAPVSSAAEDAPLCIRIQKQTQAGIVPTDHFALIRDYEDERITPDIWIPSAFIADLALPVKFDASKKAFTVRLDKPAERLGIPALGQFAPNALELDFAAKSEDGRQHFNISDIEQVTGISYILSKNRTDASQSTLVVGPSSLVKKERRAREKTELDPLPKAFNLLWDHVTRDNPDLSAEEKISAVDVLSPTWFALADEKGGMSNRGSVAYVRAAHDRGYRVWALVSNGFNKERTTKFFADEAAQNRFIARLLACARIYGFDGINVDFEGVDNNDAARLTAFVKKLAAAARTMGLTISIDIMVPSNWSKCYERPALSKIVDYVAVMTYDEHWRTSPKAGSTASIPWVTAKLRDTLADIPAEKLLLGVPLYTREWEETKGKNGKVSVKSKTLAMVSADLALEASGAQKKWLPQAGQNYFEYVSADKTYKVWIEDEYSLTLRMELVQKNELAGAAFWRKGFEKPEIWDQVEKFSK
ncbi:glycoside hydrolase [Synergistaceae bacterium OttesenSCG-928-I11]|nr:glycoside hydrolase [Synergistaceae bacterium OttesenSCG-928-I11]